MRSRPWLCDPWSGVVGALALLSATGCVGRRRISWTRRLPVVLAALLATAVVPPPTGATDLVILDEGLAAGWEDWSWYAGIDVDFESPDQAHSGTLSTAVTFGDAYAALSLRTAPPVATSGYTSLAFWIRGAGATGTHLAIALQSTDDEPIGAVVTITAPADVWTEVVIPFSGLGDPAAVARINLQDDGNEDLLATFYVDGLGLRDGATEVPIFADGFETGDARAWCDSAGCDPPDTVSPLVVTPGTTTVAGTPLPARTVAWTDAGGEPREAVMVDQRAGGAGYLRRLTYRIGGVDRVCTGASAGAIQGFGYVTNHLGDPADFGGSWGNWSPGVAGTTTVVLEGRHHAILRYDMPGYPLGGRTIPTAVEWFFATGRSHPVWSVAQDARAHPQGNLGADSRSPYGEMAIAGDDEGTKRIAGVSWGDTRKFVTVVNGTTEESTLLEGSSGWRYDQHNTIPYVLAWIEDVDAEQGTVATRPIAQQDQGSDPREYPPTGFAKGATDLDGPLPLDDDWAYQLMNYPIPPAGGTTNRRMAWGTNVGALGGFDNWWSGCGCDLQEFSRHRDSTTPFSGSRENGLLLAYSTHVVFGPHASGYQGGATGTMVAQMENVQLASFTATVGVVRAAGPRGIGPASDVTVPYTPAGYNPVYATWDVDADGGAATVTLVPAPGRPLRNPVLVVHGYTEEAPPGTVRIGGATAVADADYAASVDPDADRLWITLLRTVSSGLQVQIVP